MRLLVEPGEPVRLRKLVIEGNPAMSRSDLEELLGVREGEPFDREHLELGLERTKALLMRRRYLGTRTAVVRVTADASKTSAEVVVTVDAGQRYRLRYVGNHMISDAALRQVLSEGKIEGIDALGLARAKAAIEQAYHFAGYARVKVAVDDAPATRPNDDDAERELRFFIDEGPRAEVTDVIIDGAKARKADELRDEVWSTVAAATPESGLLQPIDTGDVDDLLNSATGAERKQPRPFEISDESLDLFPRPLIGRKPIYLESAFLEAGRRIVDLYRSDGFLDVAVRGPATTFSEDGRKITVRYVIEEGPRVTVSAVRFVDARPCATSADAPCAQSLSFGELLAEVKLQPGQPASFAAVADARATLERNLQDRGYPMARVTENVERLPSKPEVDLVYTVDPGARVAIGKVRTRGNEVTQDMVILDRVTLKPNDLYSASEVEKSRERLARLGLFSSVSVELLDDNPDAAVRDLLVVVKERPQFAVEVGAGASVEDGPRAFLAGEIRNIFGLGVGLRGRGQLNYPRAFYGFLYDAKDANNPLLRFNTNTGNPIVDWGQFFEGQVVVTGELPKVYGMPFDTRLHVDTEALRAIRPAFTLNRASVLVGFDMQPTTWLSVGPVVEGEVSDFDCPKDLHLGVSCGEGNAG
ncbi:MAG TPA: POTRA domain-containing protein, partial [Myxococcota bacterium]